MRRHPDRVENYDERYSDNRENLASLPRKRRMRGRSPFGEALAEILAGCRCLLTPGGHLAITARPYRRDGALIDLPGEIVALGRTAGLRLEGRHIALLCGLRAEELVPRASFFQMQRQRSGAIPRMLLISHEDVLVFRRP